jgi:hypothetical protein
MPLYRWNDREAMPGAANARRRLIDGQLTFMTREGLAWTVHEELPDDRVVDRPPAPPGAPGRGTLVFTSDTMKRRVLRYPSDWATLPIEALEELALAP